MHSQHNRPFAIMNPKLFQQFTWLVLLIVAASSNANAAPPVRPRTSWNHKIQRPKLAFQTHARSCHLNTSRTLQNLRRLCHQRGHYFQYTNHQRSCHLTLAPKQHNDIDLGDCLSKSLITQPNLKLIQSTSNEITRRALLFNLLTITLLTTQPQQTQASEIDATGELYSPKNEMLRGGSDAARGIALKSKNRGEGKKGELLKTGGLIQNVYETRFVAYLARFLLVFDPAASAWWKVCSHRYLMANVVAT